MLLLFNIEIDMDIITGIITGLFSILAVLGIVTDPDSKSKAYKDDLILCSGCHKKTKHILINGDMICVACGCKNCNITDDDSTRTDQ